MAVSNRCTGNVAVALVLLLLFVIGFASLALFSASPAPMTSGPVAVSVSSSGPPVAVSGSAGTTSGPNDRTSVPDSTNIEFRRPTDYDKTFEGTGTLAVDVRVQPGAVFPDTWTLHLQPSATQEGRRFAQAMTFEYPGPQRSVEVIDVALGAYDVYATAKGLSSMPSPVVLHGIEGSPHATGGMYKRMTMTMVGAPSVTTRVLRADGRPAEELDVHLRRVVGQGHYSARTDANGQAVFDGVAPGEWLLVTGDTQRSFTTPERFEVASKAVDLPDLTLPALVDVEVTAIDDLMRPLPDAKLQGVRRESGYGGFEGVADELGRLRARYLPAGAWRFQGEHEELALAGMRDHRLELEGEFAAQDPDGFIRLNVLLQPKNGGDR